MGIKDRRVELSDVSSIEQMFAMLAHAVAIQPGSFTMLTYGKGGALVPATTLDNMPSVAKVWLQPNGTSPSSSSFSPRRRARRFTQ